MLKWLRGLLIADPLIIFSFIAFGSVSIAVSLFDRTGNTAIRVARAWARFLLAGSGVRVNVEGLENLQSDSSYVFLSNHLSYMDTPVVLAHVPVQFRFLAKRGLFQIPFLGTHLSQAGHIPVPREDPRAAVKTLQLAAKTIQEKKVSLLVFPEGGRSPDGTLQDFKEGGAYIGIRAGVPLVPIVLIGTNNILPYGNAVVLPGTVTLRVLRPVDTASLTLKDRGAITEHIQRLIAAQLDLMRRAA